MNREQAYNQYWKKFNVQVFDELSVPTKGVQFPYITYNYSVGSFNDAVQMNVSVWDKSTSWERLTEIANQIGDDLSNGGITLPYDGGMVWLVKGEPWLQRLSDDDTHKRVYLNVVAEFIED